jgi:hypothetical protein
MLSARRIVAVLLLGCPLVVHAAEGDLSMPVLVGTPVWTYTYAQNGQPAKTTTISDRCVLIEATGLFYAVTDRVRLGLTLQFSQALTNPPPASSFTGFSIAPSLGYNFWGPLIVSISPTFVLRRNGVGEFGFIVTGNLYASVPLGAGVAFVAGLSVQNFLTPVLSTALIPFAGLSFKLASGLG